MDKTQRVKEVADAPAHIEQIQDRLTALELAVSWILCNHTEDKGGAFLSRQANQLEEEGKFPGVIERLDWLNEFVFALHELRQHSEEMRRE